MKTLDIPIRQVAPHRTWERIRVHIPEGRTLIEQEWAGRHRAILYLLWLHALGLPAFGLYQGFTFLQSLGEGLLIALIGLAATWSKISRRTRSVISSLGLMSASAVLIQFANGYIEVHFYYFIILVVVAMYEDWIPYLLATTTSMMK